MFRPEIYIMLSIIMYLLVMLIVGYVCSKKNNTTDDFYLGGRKLGPVVTAMSAEASDMSSWLLMGLPGLTYVSGICDASWTALGLAIGTYVNWLIVAKRIRRYSHVANNSITIPDFFSNRYRDNSNIIMMISASIIIIFFVPYTASGFAACGKIFSSLFGINYLTAMIISAVVIVGYTALGGFLAASTTDLIQSIIMSIALVIVLAFGIQTAGGMNAVIENAKSISGYLSMNTIHDVVSGTSVEYGIVSKISTIAWGLGYFGMPHILLRFMAIEDDKKLSISRRIATLWVIISLAAAILIGVVGLSMTKAGAIEVLFGSSSETIVVKIASLLSTYGAIPAIIAGIILAGILASTMSTADSQLIAASSAVSKNLYGVFNKNKNLKLSMKTARFTLIAIAVIAAFIARNPDSSVFEIVSFAWAGFGAAFGPLVLFSLFWRRTNRYGAIAGMVSGGGMVFLWKYIVKPIGGFLGIYELLPAFIVSSFVIIIVSLLTEKPSKEITDEFDIVKNMKD